MGPDAGDVQTPEIYRNQGQGIQGISLEAGQRKRHAPFFSNWPELQYARYRDLEKVEEVLSEGHKVWIYEADTIIIVLSGFDDWRDQPYTTASASRFPMGAISIGCDTQNMVLSASALASQTKGDEQME